jgi:hypothetical protein
MKLLAAAILTVAVVALVVGWRATQHHKHCTPTSGLFARSC